MEKEERETKNDIIVIGAGASGLGAAHTIFKKIRDQVWNDMNQSTTQTNIGQKDIGSIEEKGQKISKEEMEREIEKRLPRITIVEGRKEVGGRCRSIKMGNMYVDIGGTWVEGWTNNNPLYELLKETEGFETEGIRSGCRCTIIDYDGTIASTPTHINENGKQIHTWTSKEIRQNIHTRTI